MLPFLSSNLRPSPLEQLSALSPRLSGFALRALGFNSMHAAGGQSPIQLLSANIDSECTVESFRRGKAIACFPRTFKDAIKIAQSLAIDYIWIDSLCIVQDSIEDRCSEIGKMGDVYKHSICNIATMDAHHSGERFLDPQNSCPWLW